MPPFPVDTSVWLALPIGVAFGAILERAGLGSARTISQQLSFANWTVVKVMFSAIVTAMLALFWSAQLGWLDISRVAIPETDVIPQTIGAAIFGAGFALASLCPGTACVSAASGRRDGLVAVGAIAIGSILTAEFWPALGKVAENAPRNSATLATDLGVPAGAVVFCISLLAIAAFLLAERMEHPVQIEQTRSVLQFISSNPIVVALVLSVLAALQRDTVSGQRLLTTIAGEIGNEADHVEAIQLGDWIRQQRPGVRVVEVVESVADVNPDDYTIPGSAAVSLVDIPNLQVLQADTLVLYSAGGTHAAQAWVLLRARGLPSVFVLRDGLAAWEDEIMSPAPPTDSSVSSLARYQHARELQRWFGGTIPDQGNVWSAPTAPPRSGKPARRRRNTC
jgi:uncharacterized protein